MQTRAIQSKMKSINGIRKITKTMEMVSVSKMKRAQIYAFGGRKYAEMAYNIIAQISNIALLEHVLVHRRTDAPNRILIILGSDKGLCGSFNTVLYRFVTEYVQKQTGLVSAICIGKYADKIARRSGVGITHSYGVLPIENLGDIVYGIVKSISDMYTADKSIGGIDIVYQHIKSSLGTEPVCIPLLPYSRSEPVDTDILQSEFTWEPNQAHILDNVIPGIIQSLMLHALYESRAAEHMTRMIAMKSATDNANQFYDYLKLSFNRARQAGITQEIAEIVGGSNVAPE